MAAAGAAGSDKSRREFLHQCKVMLFGWRYPLNNSEMSLFVSILYEVYRPSTGAEKNKGGTKEVRQKKMDFLAEMLDEFERHASCFKKKTKTDLLGAFVSSDVKHSPELRDNLGLEFRRYVTDLNRKYGDVLGREVVGNGSW